MLWSVLLVACGSRSQLLSETEGSPGEAGSSSVTGGAGIVMPGFGGTFVTGGTFMAGGAFTTGGVMPTGGFGGGGFAGGGFAGAGAAGSPIAGQGGEGGTGPEPGDVLWGKRFGDELPLQYASALAVEPNGTFTITGGLYGSADFGSGKVGDDSDLNLYLAQFDADGSPRWDRLWSSAGQQEGLGLAQASDGRLSVVGSFSGSLDFDGQVLQSAGNADAFLLGFDRDGVYQTGARFGDSDNQVAAGVAVSAAGQQAWAGYFRGKLDFEELPVTSGGSVDAIIAGFDRDGAYSWDLSGGNALEQRANAIAYAVADDTLFVAGEMNGVMRIGACAPLKSSGETDVWLAWLDWGGNCLRSARFGDASTQTARAVAVGKAAGSNLVAVAGDFAGTLDVAGGATAIDTDAFLLLLSVDRGTQTLTPQWIRRIGGSGGQTATSVSFDAHDNVIVVGAHTGDVNDPPLEPLGDKLSNAFVVKYDSAGNLQWSRSFGDDDAQGARAVGTDAAGNVYVAGRFFGSIPLAAGTLTSAGADDAFVLKLAP